MIIVLATESTMVSDDQATDIPEMPVIISNYDASEGVGITGHDGENIYFSYRMAKEIAKVILDYSKPKKKSK